MVWARASQRVNISNVAGPISSERNFLCGMEIPGTWGLPASFVWTGWELTSPTWGFLCLKESGQLISQAQSSVY